MQKKVMNVPLAIMKIVRLAIQTKKKIVILVMMDIIYLKMIKQNVSKA